MKRPAPRCSEALSVRSTCADGSAAPPSLALAANGASTDSSATAAAASSAEPGRRLAKDLVMRGHPVRHGLEGSHPAPDRHGQEEQEVEQRQYPGDPGQRVGTRL